MALFGIPSATLRPTALVLNIFVASFGAWRFTKAGLFRWRGCWPFVVGAVPMAFLGGYLQLPGHIHKTILGIVLLIAAARLLWPKPLSVLTDWHDPPVAFAIPVGAGIGLLSGLDGHWRRHFFDTAAAVHGMVGDKDGIRHIGGVHSVQFGCGVAWQLCVTAIIACGVADLSDGSDAGGIGGNANWHSQICQGASVAGAGGGAGDCGIEVDRGLLR